MLSEETAPAHGWFFVYVIELQGMTTTRELLPVFVAEDGTADPELAQWLLDRSMSNRREEFGPENRSSLHATTRSTRRSPSPTARRWAGCSNARLRSRRRTDDCSPRSAANGSGSTTTAPRPPEDKLDANRRILERIRASPEDAGRRILPVWEKNVEGAQRMIESITEERSKRLAELDGRDHVSAQHELLVASFVAIEPDPKPLFDQVREGADPDDVRLVQRLCVSVSAHELARGGQWYKSAAAS